MAKRPGVSFKFRTGGIPRKLKQLDAESEAMLGVIVEANSAKGEAYMKTNAPWSDDTGFARSSLNSHVVAAPKKYTIVFSHGAHYGIWLEIKQSGKYEIIMPTVRHVARSIGDDLNGMWGRLP